MLSEYHKTNHQYEDMDNNIPSQFLNVFGFIDYKHNGSFPWTTENVLLSEEYRSETDLLGIDCEMVGVGSYGISALGRVSIVNEYGYCVYDTFVNPLEEITDYCTQYSGIRAEDLVNAPPVDLIVRKVASIVEGRILVGHSIHNDLEVLKLNHPIAATRDTANFFQHHNGNKRTPSLKNLIKEFFNASIQDGEHSSIQDAQAALKLYLLFREEWEKDALERRRKANLAETVTDIMCMHVQPRPPDLFTESESVFTRPNKLVGAYYSSEEYKDIQFRLLMEDVLRPLRQDIRILKRRKLMDNHYKNIRISAGNSLEEINFEVRSYKTLLVPIPVNRLEDVDWDDRKIFLAGSLLVLSPDNFRTMKCAKVIDIGKNQRDDSVILHLHVNFLLDGPTWKITSKDKFEMIESKAFFLPYEYTLNFLQDIDLETFPMKKYIVDSVTKSDIPSNLLKDSINQIDFSILMNNVTSQTKIRARPLDYENWPNASQLNLDQSQYEGLQMALTQELTIIQGPPGTGKSHVSLQIVKLLLTNKWLSPSPILIVSYTNHALDELLESVLEFLTDGMHGGDLKKAEQSLLRIGGGCESEAILPCTMKFKREMLREKSLNKKNVKTLEKALLKVNGLDFKSKLIHQGIVNFKLIPQAMLAKLETDEATKDIFKLWMKSQKEMENDVLSWFGLNKESIEVRPMSLTSISDRMFVLLCNNLESVLMEIFPQIPSTFEELKGKRLYNADRHQQSLIRWGYYLFFVGQLAEIVKTTQNELILANKASKELEHYVKENATLKQAKVVGMTTTGAVKYKKMVETKLKPTIMLVEEAAHVLEAYVVASLTKHCTQMILIGDHKQLRPMISDHDLTKDFLDVSLMERLVQNGIATNTKNWTQLKVQHRMRTEIAELICPVIYDELENHSDVEKYPNVMGCSKNVFFVHHENPENLEARSRSRYNAYEAKYIIGLLAYFTERGYLPTQITVICAYLAQKIIIENTIKNDLKINQCQISTVDGYQGKQNDLIILSLVRNNKDNNVGFLKTDNRVCVALSRARHGLIIIGNMTILAPSSDTWSKINQILMDSNSIGTELPLNYPLLFKPQDTLVYSTIRPSSNPKSGRVRTRRPRRSRRSKKQSNPITTTAAAAHSCGSQGMLKNAKASKALARGHGISAPMESSNVICTVGALEQLPCGHKRRNQNGNGTKCGYVMRKKMECGHVIDTACHKFSTATCIAAVQKMFPCGHQDTVPCHQQKCIRKIIKELSCGHKMLIFCKDKNSQFKCRVDVVCRFPCGHQKKVSCASAKNVTCDTKTTMRLSCGHSAEVSCTLRSSGKVKCNLTVEEKLSCGHARQILCRNWQGRETKCDAVVQKKMNCGHTIPVACHMSSTATTCVVKVKKTFPCGHEEQVFCREKNANVKCPAVIKRKYPCGHQHLFPCLNGAEKNYKKCNSNIKRILPCGHTQSTACHQKADKIKCRHLMDFGYLKLECHTVKEFANQIEDLKNRIAKIQLKD